MSTPLTGAKAAPAGPPAAIARSSAVAPHLYCDPRMTMTRRGLLGGAAAAALTSKWCVSEAHAQEAPPVYPTLFIKLRGGWDPVQHFCGRVGATNRAVTAGQLATAASGAVYFTPILSTMAAHVDDAVVIRNVNMAGTDHRVGANILWYGRLLNQTSRTPWTNYLASRLLARAPAVAPNLAAYWTYDSSGGVNDFVNFNNKSPDPLGAAQRLLSIDGFARSLDLTGGLPTAARQRRINAFLGAFDARQYSPAVQAPLLQAWGQATRQANELVEQPVTKLWPPDAATMNAFNATAAQLTARGFQGIPGFKAMCMLAYQLARTRASHVISFDGDTALGGTTYDTHSNNVTGQLAAGLRFFRPIAQLLSALKATPSPVVPGKTMFDTTHVVISSEMGRSPNAQNDTGTNHWPWTHALLFGGNFKRGYAFGEMTDGLIGVPASFTTGKLEAAAPMTTWLNVVATVLKANGVDPAGYDTAAPIGAVLQ